MSSSIAEQILPQIDIMHISRADELADQLIHLFELTVDYDLLGQVFYEGDVLTQYDFAQAISTGELFIAVMNGTTVGYAWLNLFFGGSAGVNFCLFPPVWGKQSLIIGKDFIREVFAMEDAVRGGPWRHSLFGLTPSTNKLALRFLRRVGFKDQGVIPSGARVHGMLVDAVITTITRDEVLHG